MKHFHDYDSCLTFKLNSRASISYREFIKSHFSLENLIQPLNLFVLVRAKAIEALRLLNLYHN